MTQEDLHIYPPTPVPKEWQEMHSELGAAHYADYINGPSHALYLKKLLGSSAIKAMIEPAPTALSFANKSIALSPTILGSEQEALLAEAIHASARHIPDPASTNLVRRAQHDAERTYEDQIVLDPAATGARLTIDDVARRLEYSHVVKRAPTFAEQLADSVGRKHRILHGPARDGMSKTSASSPEKDAPTEYAVLQDLHDFLRTAANDEPLGERRTLRAAALLEGLTFIGKKEYQEATSAIAAYWKHSLEQNPDLQILALNGAISRNHSYPGDPAIKSDMFMLDNVLAYFSEREMHRYADRLVTHEQYLRAPRSGDLKVVLMDDWTISGSQINNASKLLLREHPNFGPALEVQLIVANEQRLKLGQEQSDQMGQSVPGVPVRAYYLAHQSKLEATRSGTHITGYHSSVDYDFENELSEIVSARRYSRGDVTATMPLGTNIIRPYRMPGARLFNIERLEQCNQRASVVV